MDASQDNDPKHTAKIVKKWLQDNQINVLELPSQSPDLNLIENLWHKLKTQVKLRNPRNLRDLEEFCKEWSKISVKVCRNLIVMYPNRVQVIIMAKGHAIDY